MDERKHTTDEIFSEKLKNYRKDPPELIWEGIVENMTVQRRKKMLVPFLRMAAGMAILTAFGLGYFYFRNLDNGKLNEPLAGQETKKTAPVEKIRTERTEKQKVATTSPAQHKTVSANENSTTPPPVTAKKISLQNTGKIVTTDINIPVIKDQVSFPATGNEELTGANPPLESNNRIPDDRYRNLPFPGTHHTADDTIIKNESKLIASWDMLIPYTELQTRKSPAEGKIYLSASFSPVYSYRSLENQKADIQTYYNQSENPMISYSGGINVGIQASKRLSIQSGVIYSRLGIEVDNIETFAGLISEHNDSNIGTIRETNLIFVGNSIGEVSSAESEQILVSANSSSKNLMTSYTDSPGTLFSNIGSYDPASFSINQLFHFIEVPFMLQYKVIDRTIDLNLLGGLSTNFLLASDVILNNDGEKSYFGTTRDVRKVNYSGNIGIGMDIDVSKRLLFTLEPQLKYYLNSFNNHNLIATRPYYIGLYTGVRYEF